MAQPNKRGGLSLTDKMAIKGALAEKQSVESIAKMIKRTPEAVQSYIDGEMSRIASTIAKAQLQAANDDAVVYVDEKTRDAALKELRQAGLTELDAHKIVDKATEAARKQKRKYRDIKTFYPLCIKSMKAGEFMIKHGGATMMTGTASTKMDTAAKYQKKTVVPRSARGAVYRPKTDTMD